MRTSIIRRARCLRLSSDFQFLWPPRLLSAWPNANSLLYPQVFGYLRIRTRTCLAFQPNPKKGIFDHVPELRDTESSNHRCMLLAVTRKKHLYPSAPILQRATVSSHEFTDRV